MTDGTTIINAGIGTAKPLTAYPMLWDHEAELIFETLITVAETNERMARRTPQPMRDWFTAQGIQARKLAGRIARTFIHAEQERARQFNAESFLALEAMRAMKGEAL